jgi:hypothetical protein
LGESRLGEVVHTDPNRHECSVEGLSDSGRNSWWGRKKDFQGASSIT